MRPAGEDTFAKSTHGLWAALFAVFIVQTGFGAILPLLPQFVRRHGFPLGDMGLMAAAYAAVSFLGQLGLGPLTDRLGRKRLMVVGSVIEALGTAGFLISGPPAWYVVCRVLQGLGSAAIVPAANALVADLVPEERRGRVYGMMSAAGSAGFALGPMIGGLGGAAFGLGAPFVLGAVLNLLATATTAVLLPSRVGPAQATPVLQNRVRIRSLVRTLWPYFWVMFAWMGINGMYDTSWSLYMQWLGASRWLIGVSFTLFALPLLLFNLLGGRAADRTDRRTLLIVAGTGAQALLVAVYVASRSAWLSIGVSVVEAAAISLAGPALSAAVMDQSPEHMHGTVQGVFQASGTFGATLLALASGPLLVASPNRPFLLGSIVLVVTAIGVSVVWRVSHKL